MFCWVVPCFTGYPCPIPIKCPHSAPWSPRQSELPSPSRCSLRSRTTSGYRPLEGRVSCSMDSVPDSGLPQSTDRSRRQGKMQKLKHRSALHHIPEGWRVPAEERWPWRSHPSQWEHGRAGVAEQRRGAGETQKPCARDRAATAAQPVRPAGAVPPGPGSLSGLVEIKQINDNRWASERPV